MRRHSLLLALLAAPAAAQPAEPLTAPISGRVVDARTGEPLPGASVRLPEALLAARSDSNGFFGLPAVPVGEQTVLVSRLGYEVLGAAWTIEPPGGEVEVRLRPNVVVLEALRVRLDQFRRRREGSAFSTRGFLEGDLGSTGATTLAGFLEERGPLQRTPCGSFSSSGRPDCIVVRGSPAAPCITVDEQPVIGGLRALEHLVPGEVYSVDLVSGGRYIQVYTIDFIRRLAGRPWQPMGVAAQIEARCTGYAGQAGSVPSVEP